MTPSEVFGSTGPLRKPCEPAGRTLRAGMATLAALFLALALSGCATSSGGYFADKSLRPNEGEPRGYAIATLGVQFEEGKLPPFQENRLEFRSKTDPKASGALRMFIQSANDDPHSDLDVKDGGVRQTVVIASLRPGLYEISGTSMSTDVGVARSSQDSAPSGALAFEIRGDEITYLGSYVARVTMGKNALGMEIRSGAYFEVRDHEQRDIAFAHNRDPSLPRQAPVINATPRVQSAVGGTLVFVDGP